MASAGLQIEAAADTGNALLILHCKGPITLATVSDFQNAVLGKDAPALILDLSEVPYVDSAGLGSLVRLHTSRQRIGHRLLLAAVNERARALLQMTSLESLFQIFPSVRVSPDTSAHLTENSSLLYRRVTPLVPQLGRETPFGGHRWQQQCKAPN
jgi:anti-sigma B factor antagonist